MCVCNHISNGTNYKRQISYLLLTLLFFNPSFLLFIFFNNIYKLFSLILYIN